MDLDVGGAVAGKGPGDGEGSVDGEPVGGECGAGEGGVTFYGPELVFGRHGGRMRKIRGLRWRLSSIRSRF